MQNHERFHWLKGVLVLTCGSLLTACANTSSTHNQPSASAQNNTTIASSACIGNAYLQKYGCSMQRIQKAARAGDPDAQYALGYMYYYGVGTISDKQTAKQWIGRAAGQGQPLAVKAEQLMSGGQGLDSLHRYHANGLISNSSRARQANSYTPTPSVQALNNAKPSEPIAKVLPNYKRSNQAKTVIRSMRKNTAPAASEPASTTKPTVEPITSRYHRSNTTTAWNQGRGAITATERRMMEVPKRHYTLQLMGGRNLPAIRSFVRKNHLEGKAEFYSAKLNNKNWYMLVYGNYSTVSQARNAEKDMPLALRKMHPWIKSYRIVHDEIRLRRIVS